MFDVCVLDLSFAKHQGRTRTAVGLTRPGVACPHVLEANPCGLGEISGQPKLLGSCLEAAFEHLVYKSAEFARCTVEVNKPKWSDIGRAWSIRAKRAPSIDQRASVRTASSSEGKQRQVCRCSACLCVCRVDRGSLGPRLGGTDRSGTSPEHVRPGRSRCELQRICVCVCMEYGEQWSRRQGANPAKAPPVTARRLKSMLRASNFVEKAFLGGATFPHSCRPEARSFGSPSVGRLGGPAGGRVRRAVGCSGGRPAVGRSIGQSPDIGRHVVQGFPNKCRPPPLQVGISAYSAHPFSRSRKHTIGATRRRLGCITPQMNHFTGAIIACQEHQERQRTLMLARFVSVWCAEGRMACASPPAIARRVRGVSSPSRRSCARPRKGPLCSALVGAVAEGAAPAQQQRASSRAQTPQVAGEATLAATTTGAAATVTGRHRRQTPPLSEVTSSVVGC